MKAVILNPLLLSSGVLLVTFECILESRNQIVALITRKSPKLSKSNFYERGRGEKEVKLFDIENRIYFTVWFKDKSGKGRSKMNNGANVSTMGNCEVVECK